jgi:hypothetical protein
MGHQCGVRRGGPVGRGGWVVARTRHEDVRDASEALAEGHRVDHLTEGRASFTSYDRVDELGAIQVMGCRGGVMAANDDAGSRQSFANVLCERFDGCRFVGVAGEAHDVGLETPELALESRERPAEEA